MRSLSAALLAFGLSLPCFAQTASLLDTELSRGLTLWPTSAALVDEATAAAVNPAGLSYVKDPQLWYLHERSIARSDVGDGIYLASTFFDALSAAVSVEWMRGTSIPSYRKTNWAFALGSQDLSLGVGFNSFSAPGSDLNGMSSVDLGIASRPFRFLSLGGTIKSIDAPSNGSVSFERRFDIGAGFRIPSIGDRYTLAADFLFGDNLGASAGRFQYTLKVEPISGLVVGAGVSNGLRAGDDLLFQFSLALNAEHLGLTYAIGASSSGLDHLVGVRASIQKYPPLSVMNGKVAMFDLGDMLSGSQNPALSLLGIHTEDPYLRVTRMLDLASRDDRLRGVVLKVDNIPAGLGKTQELRDAIIRLRAAGKTVIAVMLMGGDSEYLIASACDRIYAVPQAILMVNGFAAHTTFLGTAMNKLGVSWNVARVGAYKNAPDALTRSTISKEQQESVDGLLDTDVREDEAALDISRHLSKQKVEAVWKEGLTTPARAKELGLIDDVLDPQDLSKTLGELVPGARYDAEYRPADLRDLRWGDKRKIAIVPVIGTITGGKNRDEPLGGEEIAGADSVVRAVKRAAEDSSVAAIILRVDSGGGDGMASDLMYRAVLEARKKKPVIASMGDVAASGGYYAAMAADEIWAEPTTITGSIGVFMLKPALAGLGDKLGVHQDVSTRGDLADIIGLYHPWTPEEQTAAQRWVDAFYDDFITEVSKSRHIDKAEVDKIARGRVWSGADAKARKLVDNMGGLLEAIDAARKRAGIPEKEDIDLVVESESGGLFGSGPSELMEKLFPAQPDERVPASLRALARELGIDERELEAPGAMRAEMPFKLVVK